LKTVLAKKSEETHHIIKTGRTHLMDAMPVRFSQVISGWIAQVEHAESLLIYNQHQLQRLAIGGTAVGTGVNAPAGFAKDVCAELSKITGVVFSPADNRFAAMGAQDTVVATGAALKTLAVALMKIANDLRWMNSGPLAGLGEIELPALQPGSSIMPGKVNPVIPEAVAMACAQVIGNDTTITVAGQSGNFELNVMLPVMASKILDSTGLMARSAISLADQAIAGFTVKEDVIKEPLARNPVLVTALNPVIGYLKAAEIAKKAYKEGRAVIDVAEEMTEISRDELEILLDPARLV
jgi:fumarate hydratase class II